MTNTTDNADAQPTELNDLKAVLKEFLDRKANIENEISALQEDLKGLVEEFSDRLDMKTLKKALQVTKIEASVLHKDTYDNMVEVLKDPS